MLYALVVIYNKNCEESQSIQSLIKYKSNIKIIVFDNSSIINNNKTFCLKHNFIYYSLNKNMGLSKAYNYVIDKVEKNDSNYLMILDDDTVLTKEYIEETYKYVVKKEYDIILPIVKPNKIILSPSNIMHKCRVVKINNIDDINIKKITAINSGMVVKTSVYKIFKYNESLFLDYVDHDFMKKVRINNLYIKILKSEIFQNFSREEKVTSKNFKFRFNIYRKDFKKYCKENRNILFYYLSITKYIIVNLDKFLKR